MGKPSESRLSNKSSESAKAKNSNSSLHSKLNTVKFKNSIMKLKKKQRQSIHKLFKELRDQSCSSTNNSLNNTVIVLDDSNSEIQPNRKRKTDDNQNNLLKKIKPNDDSLIIIKDDTSTTPTKKSETNVNCSTPLNGSRGKKLDLNISGVSNSKSIESSINIKKDIADLTKEINGESYLTIDLTNETLDSKADQQTVIDLEKTEDHSEVSLGNTSLSMSGDSDVTVLNKSQFAKRKTKRMQKFARGISKLNSKEKGKLLELITQKIFNGCSVTPHTSVQSIHEKKSRAVETETAEDTYIREVILGEAPSRNSVGSNIYNPEREIKNKSGLRMIVIDGSNVAMTHGKHRQFSVRGLKICIDYFVRRGHIVKAFVPRFRCKFGKSTDPRLLDDLERSGLVVYTPSREVQGRFICPYDDRYILQCAAEFDGVVVSGDNYRDLIDENPKWRQVIVNRLLPFTWVNDMIMFPKDPLGRHGPSLEVFLRHT